MSAPRKGDWIQTYTLRQFWPLDPRPEEVCIEDIAHAQSHKARFSGHTRTLYVVAEHSVRVSRLAEARACDLGLSRAGVLYVARWGLLHDGSDAYLPDVPRPVKYLPEMAPFRAAEALVQQAVCTAFGLGHFEPRIVKEADKQLCATEARDLFDGLHPAWVQPAEPLSIRITPWSPSEAKALFLERYLELWPGGAP